MSERRCQRKFRCAGTLWEITGAAENLPRDSQSSPQPNEEAGEEKVIIAKQLSNRADKGGMEPGPRE